VQTQHRLTALPEGILSPRTRQQRDIDNVLRHMKLVCILCFFVNFADLFMCCVLENQTPILENFSGKSGPLPVIFDAGNQVIFRLFLNTTGILF